MERLFSGPLRGRLIGLAVEPLDFRQAMTYLDEDSDAVERIARHAIAGGMSLYLDEIGRGATLERRIRDRVLGPRARLFNDRRQVLEEELRAPTIYYSLLEELATGKKSLADLAGALSRRTTDLQGYLKAGLPPGVLYRSEIAPQLADHISPTFERLCRLWALQTAAATRVVHGGGTRSTSIVGLARGRATRSTSPPKPIGGDTGRRVQMDIRSDERARPQRPRPVQGPGNAPAEIAVRQTEPSDRAVQQERFHRAARGDLRLGVRLRSYASARERSASRRLFATGTRT
jgi:hypothetical protein